MPDTYRELAADYELLLGTLAMDTWRHGVLAELPHLHLPTGSTAATVVDLGAGTGIGGRLLAGAMPSLHRIGVDASAAMLKYAARWYHRTVQADLRRLPLDAGCAEIMVSGFDTLNYLDPAVLSRCLHEISRCLAPAGWLVFDYSSPQLLRRHWSDHAEVQTVANGSVHWSHRFDPDSDACISTVRRCTLAGEIAWQEQHFQYALDAYPLHLAATAAGLHVHRVRDLDRDYFSPASHTHVWLLQKG